MLRARPAAVKTRLSVSYAANGSFTKLIAIRDVFPTSKVRCWLYELEMYL